MGRIAWWQQLRVRLLVGLTVLIVSSALATDFAVQRILSRELPQVELQAVTQQAARLRDGLERAYSEHGQISTKLLDQPPVVPLRIYAADGTLLETSSWMPPDQTVDAVVRALHNETQAATIVVEGDRRFGYDVLPIRSDGAVVGAIEVAEDLPPISQFQSSLQRDIVRITIISLSAIVAFCVYLGVRFGQALEAIKQQTVAITHGDFNRRIQVTTPDEIGQIGLHLNQMADGLQRLTRTRTEFLSKVSHELRTPLTIAQGFASTLRHGPLLPEQERTVGVIDDQIAELTRLVNDLLDLSRRQHSNLDLATHEIECGDLIHAVAEQHQPLLNDSNLRLDLHAPSTPLRIHGDRQRLQQVLSNLIGNASRYSRTCVWLELDADHDHAIMRVRDDGPGIAPEDVSRIFEPFCQLSGGPRGRAGLGLTIVRELVTAHGGTVSVDSRLGHGTCFTIRLPRVVVERGRKPSRARSRKLARWTQEPLSENAPTSSSL